MGKGWDRHLYALKAMAEREKLPVPEFFQDPVQFFRCLRW